MQEFPENGGVLGSEMHFRIWVKQGAWDWEMRFNDVVKGRYSQLTEFEYFVPVDNLGGNRDQFIFRVELITPTDTDTQRYQRALRVQSYTEVTQTKLSYPNSAMVWVRVDAEQFSSSPNFGFLVKGRRIAIPTNATVDLNDRGLNFTGAWDGTFYTPLYACADPVWILYDLLTNTRYGLGRYIKFGNINRYSFYEISQYCNQLVSNGQGAQERRFLCNVVIDGTQDAYKVIESLRSIFRGFSYFMNGAISFVADMPGSVAMQFTQADILDGMFSYARTALKTRHTVAHVTWIDPLDFYRRAIEVVEDNEGIDKFGVRVLELSAFGCTSRSQARRAGLAALFTERIEVETVTFKARAYAASCTPGMIIRVHDARRAEIRYGGLIADYDVLENSITIDNPVNLSLAENYAINYTAQDGTIQERVINPSSTGNKMMIFGTNISASPLPQIEGNWIITSTTIEPQLFRVLNRVAVAGEEEMLYEITALQYEPQKFDAIENGWTLTPRQTRSRAPVITNKPIGVSAGFNILQPTPTTRSYTLIANWQRPITADGRIDEYTNSYLVEYRKGDSGDWVGTTSVTTLYHEITNLSTDVYYVRVAAIDLLGGTSVWVESSAVLVGTINTDLSFAGTHSSMLLMEF
jgi:predicted phage tail protein